MIKAGRSVEFCETWGRNRKISYIEYKKAGHSEKLVQLKSEKSPPKTGQLACMNMVILSTILYEC